MSNNINDFKKIYKDIEIPHDLNDYAKNAIKKGRIEMKKQNSKKSGFKGVAAAVFVFVLFTASINTMSSLAESMEDIPVLGELVRILQFNKGTAEGGIITDGADVNGVVLEEEVDSETLIISLTKNGEVLEEATHYQVDYYKYPYTMTFTISGARNFSAEKNFETLKESKFISDVYKLITLDDSTIRFTIVFNNPVKFEVKEYKDPAQIQINLTKDDEEIQKNIYSVRTSSYPQGEGFAMIEEQLFSVETRRVIKDAEGTFIIEVGTFDSEEEANGILQELTDKFSNVKFQVEKRNRVDIPKAIY